MSCLTEKEIACSECKIPLMAEVWSIINVREDVELKDLMLGGEINMIECPSCKNVFYSEQFLLYHDPDQALMAFVYPRSYESEKNQWEAKTQQDFEAMQASAAEQDRLPYKPFTFFGLDKLMEMVQWEEEAKLQAEIVELLSKQHGFSIKKLTPTVARSLHLPPVLPLKDDILGGLTNLLQINDRLSIYRETIQRIESIPSVGLA